MHTAHDKLFPTDGSGTLKVALPYHFGWRHESNGNGTIQEINLDAFVHDLILYKENDTIAIIKRWKPLNIT